MPSKKQRRRREKSRRHEYEYVYVDEEGREMDVDPAELRADKKERPRPADRRNGTAPAARRGARRAPQPPSWGRAARRAAIVGVFFVVVFGFVLRGKNTNPASAVLIGVIYALAFIPLQYFIDHMVHRAYLKRQAARPKNRQT